MAINTIYTYPLNGSNREFHIPFEYLARKFVVITLIGTDRRELVLTEDYRFTTRAHIQTNRVWGPADGYERIEVRRLTSATERLVDFSDGSILRASELNISQVQTLHVAEEARNMVADTIAENSDGDLDARGRRLVNLADAIQPDHAVTLRQEMAWAEGALNSRNAAAGSQQNARDSEVSAKASEVAAKASEVAAKASENLSRKAEEGSLYWAQEARKADSQAQAAKASSEAARDVSIARSQISYDASQSSYYWAQQAAASAAGVNLPAGRGPRYILASKPDNSGLEYRFRWPTDTRDNGPDTLLQVGSWGLGGTALSLQGVSANTLNQTGFFYLNNGSDGPVANYYGWILNVEITPGEYTYQFAFDVSGRAWRRARSVNWGAWHADYTGLTVSQHIRALMGSAGPTESRSIIGASERKRRRMVQELLWSGAKLNSGSISADPVIQAGDTIQFQVDGSEITNSVVVVASSARHFATWGQSGYVSFTSPGDGRISWTTLSGYGVTAIFRLWVEE